jgi:hypothetical protein
MPSAYMENTLNGEKSIKIQHISVNNGTKIIDPFFQSLIGLIKPNNHLTLLLKWNE